MNNRLDKNKLSSLATFMKALVTTRSRLYNQNWIPGHTFTTVAKMQQNNCSWSSLPEPRFFRFNPLDGCAVPVHYNPLDSVQLSGIQGITSSPAAAAGLKLISKYTEPDIPSNSISLAAALANVNTSQNPFVSNLNGYGNRITQNGRWVTNQIMDFVGLFPSYNWHL